MDRLDDAAVRVADDEPDAGEAALEEPPHEARPGVALVVARRQLQGEHPPLATARHPDRDEAGHAHHPPRIAHLDV